MSDAANRLHPLHRLWRALPTGARRRLLAQGTALLAPRPDRPPPPARDGVIVAGELARASGLGEGARLMLAGLAELGVAGWPLRAGLRLPGETEDIPVQSGPPPPPGAPLVLHVNAPHVAAALLQLPRGLVRGRRVIGCWAWELPVAPRDWATGLRFVHEVWVPSRFTAAAIEPLLPGRVRVVPYCVASNPPRPSALDRQAFGYGSDAVIVLCSFSLASSFERKNPLAAIAAHRAAFGERADRVLVMKIGHAGHFGADMQRLRDAAAGAANIRFETRTLPLADNHALTACADIVLSLHRSEGFGLVPAEGMLLGRAVVLTDWSGNTDFTDSETAALVPYRLVPAVDPRGRVSGTWRSVGGGRYRRRRRASAPAGGGCGRAACLGRPRAGGRQGAAGTGEAGRCVAGDWADAVRLLVWQWGRRGAGPRYALELARGLRLVPGVEVVLSLSENAEILAGGLPECDLPLPTYGGLAGWLRRLVGIPLEAPMLARRLRALRLDGAVCAMPAPLDLLMAAALRRAGVKFAVAVHDATLHPGDILPLQAVLQRRLLRRASALVALSGHVAKQLAPLAAGRPLLQARLSPLDYGGSRTPPMAHGGRLRLLSFGRLLPYKGLGLLAAALALLPPGLAEARVVGTGPQSPELDALRRLPGVTVENRWVPEGEVGMLLGWADALILSHREASQSGVAAAALAAGRWVVSTRVGGLAEQLASAPGARLCDVDPAALAGAIESLVTDPPSATPHADDGWLASVAELAAQLAEVFPPTPQLKPSPFGRGLGEGPAPN